MSGFLIAALEFFGGMWFRGLISSRHWQARDFSLRLRETKLEMMEKAATQLTTQPRTDDLSLSIAEDALRRERRAKAAIRNMMRVQGCTEAQIEDVLNTVDNVQDGDMKT